MRIFTEAEKKDRELFECVNCERYKFDYTHVTKELRKNYIGPWNCACCGISNFLVFNADGTTTVLLDETRVELKTLVLLKLNKELAVDEPDMYVVICATTYPDKEELSDPIKLIDSINDRHDYYYSESTCPTNWFPSLKIRDGDDTDPHGVFIHVESILLPEQFDKDGTEIDNILDDPDSWSELFKHFRTEKEVQGVVLQHPSLESK